MLNRNQKRVRLSWLLPAGILPTSDMMMLFTTLGLFLVLWLGWFRGSPWRVWEAPLVHLHIFLAVSYYIYMYCIVSSDYVWLSTVEVFPSAMSCLRKKIIMVTSMMSLTCRITSNRLSWKTLLCIWGPRQKTQHSTKKWKRILLLLDSWWLSLCGFHTWPKNNPQQRSVMPPKFR